MWPGLFLLSFIVGRPGIVADKTAGILTGQKLPQNPAMGGKREEIRGEKEKSRTVVQDFFGCGTRI